MTIEPYKKWLDERRSVSPPIRLPDQIMNQIAELERKCEAIWWLRLVHRIERSRAARWAVCGGALAIGSLPFVFLASVTKILAF